ncbi:hypothetical protein RF819_16670 [Rhodoferax fermentans]|uniref:Reverse transcriptase domain-containing protein n=1 Tax=Rhodoferax fermentans TaxID=28066 RepID=A0A1T1AVI5_RHOFE|nr:hypothetical protein RF819_16670 [Rhodoferax fermentans]
MASTQISNIYSYIRTPKGSSYNYEHYLHSYRKRNQNILEALSSQKKAAALFLDLKNYYASVNKDLLIDAIKKHPILTTKKNRYSVDFLVDQVNQSPSGIPIGTELSHLLGDIYIEPLDKILKKLLGNNYFRYVDDITVVCDQGKLEQIEKDVRTVVESLGLMLNDSKREVFNTSQWRSAIDTSPVDGDDFYEYCQMLGHWIGTDIGKKNWLQIELENQGFQIPIRKIFSRNRKTHNHFAVNETEKSVIEKSVAIRNKYVTALEKVVENLSKNSNRWYLQKTKRAINPLFYLLNKQNYQTITDAAKESIKLKTQEEVSNALLKSSCDCIIKYPGVTVSTFCEIWETVQPAGFQLRNLKVNNPSVQEIESLTTLALYGIVPPLEQISTSTIWQALRPEVQYRSAALNGFEAEIESLRIGITADKQQSLLDDRLNDDEDIILSGLELGNQSISP